MKTDSAPGWMSPAATINGAWKIATRSGGPGIFARLANSLFMEWLTHQTKSAHKTTTDFTAPMAAEHARRVLLTVTARRPNLPAPS